MTRHTAQTGQNDSAEHVETELAGEIIRGAVKDGDSVVIDSDGSKLSFQTK